MDSGMPDLVGIIGVGLIVISYFLLQVERLTFNSPVYLSMNLLGASSILYSLFFEWNLAAALIEIFWIGISLLGLIRSLWRKKHADT